MLLGALVCLALWPAAAQAAWNQPEGGPSPINATPDFTIETSIATVDGVPYVTWTESNFGGISQIRVARLDPGTGTWEPVGGSVNIDPGQEANNPSIADIGGVPYVEFWERDGTNSEVRVRRFDGANWVTVGGPINSDPNQNAFTFHRNIANIGGTPYVSWHEDNGVGGEHVRVSRFDGANWVEVIPGPINVDPNQRTGGVSLIGIDGVPWVSWIEQDGTNFETRVARPNEAGTAWEEPAGGANPINRSSTQTARDAILENVGDVPYVAWAEEDAGGTAEVRVSRLVKDSNGFAWEEVAGGTNPITTAPNSFLDFHIGMTEIGGRPYVSWPEFDGTQLRDSRQPPERSGHRMGGARRWA